MAIYSFLLHNPLLACSVGLCLLAIMAAIRLVRRLRRGPERFIAGFVGLIAIYEGLRILMEVGIWKPGAALGWTNLATLVVTGLFVLALLVVQELGSEGHRTRFLLRLLEADRTDGSTTGNNDGTDLSASTTTTEPSPAATDSLVIPGAAGANAAV